MRHLASVLGLSLATALAACGGDASSGDTDPLHASDTDAATEPEPDVRSAPTSGEAYLVTYAPTPDPIPLNAYFALTVTVVANDGTSAPVPTASLSVDATMPTHGHGMNVVPTTTSNGDGTFTADGLLFHMEGDWRIEIDVDDGVGVETVAFDVACCD